MRALPEEGGRGQLRAISLRTGAIWPMADSSRCFTYDGAQRAFGFHNPLPHDLGARQEPRGREWWGIRLSPKLAECDTNDVRLLRRRSRRKSSYSIDSHDKRKGVLGAGIRLPYLLKEIAKCEKRGKRLRANSLMLT
jgi:hypothetical protein